MGMEEILEQWDQIQRNQVRKQKESGKNTVSHKKANAPTKEEKELLAARKEQRTLEAQMQHDNEQQISMMELWLRRYGTVDKDRIAEEAVEHNKMADRNYILNMKPEATIDLHGLHQDEAEQQLNNFITNCKNKGLKKVLIIHGKGLHSQEPAVLGELVRSFIERDKRCGTSGHPKNQADGGKGATWVILK